MLHVNDGDGLTIAVSQSRKVTAVAQRTVLSNNALAMLVPILEKVLGWDQPQIRDFFERNGFLVQEWEKVRTDWLTLSPRRRPGLGTSRLRMASSAARERSHAPAELDWLDRHRGLLDLLLLQGRDDVCAGSRREPHCCGSPMGC